MLLKTFYRTYMLFRWVLRTTGLLRPIRALVGPLAGRTLVRLSGQSGRPVEVMGHQMVLASSGRFAPIAMALGEYEPRTTELLERLVQPGTTVLDIGGHVGYYSLIAARKTGSAGRVFAFEPELSNYELLTQNIELNGYQNITAVNKAAFRGTGKLALHISGLDTGRHSIYDHSLPETGTQEVETVAVDSFLESQGWPKVSLVKIDVEGAEVDVLVGMDRLLREPEDIKLIVEFNPLLLQNAGVDVHQFLEIPTRWGFTVQVVDEEEGIIPLEQADPSQLVARLLSSEGSVNLFCEKQ
ncbi:MAG: FkbM family methyltransferase [SAR202 cluster bacterium]|nr:FkbM family methyltransferase [SAR202 cluster bacterium]|tara:strand:- start:1289 stop:2182 length:894 start_codon:yes stop_codon:yes gene_type:complete